MAIQARNHPRPVTLEVAQGAFVLRTEKPPPVPCQGCTKPLSQYNKTGLCSSCTVAQNRQSHYLTADQLWPAGQPRRTYRKHEDHQHR